MPPFLRSLNCGSPAEATPSGPAHAGVDAVGAARSPCWSTTIGMGAVEAGPEPFGQQVVGAAGASARSGCVPWSGDPSDASPASARPSTSSTTNDHLGLRVTNRPSVDRGLLAGSLAVSTSTGTAPSAGRSCARAGEHRDQERVRDEHRSHDAEGRADAELVTKSRPKTAAAHRDRHGSAGKSTAWPAEAPASVAASSAS